MLSFSLRQILAVLTCFAFVRLARSNTLGSPGDPSTQALLQECMSDNTTRYTEYGGKPGFGFGECPILINCVLMGSNEENKAGMSAGAAIAALIPTMLALIGAGPLEIVRLALISPSCALATSLFGIGLPSNLFSQLQRHPHSGSSDKVDYPASTQGKIVKFAFPLSVPRRRRTVARRLLLDTLILCLAAVMLWRNWRVGTMIMVTWRCEYRWLLYCWPVACVVWWIGALGSLCGVAKKIEVLNRDGGRRRSWAALSLAGYLVRKARRVGGPAGSASQALHANVKTVTPAPAPVLGPRTAPSHGVGGVEVDTDEDELLIVRVEFPTEASCRWWNTAIQAVAVGIYLYATFVLSSVLFLTGDEAIMYAVVMTLSLSAIRIMSALI